jgi:4-amino-4-deoxy-L-arabinose transferase-like glycosyltransferase
MRPSCPGEMVLPLPTPSLLELPTSPRWAARTPVVLSGVGLFAVVVHLAFLSILPIRWRINQSADYFQFYEPVAHNLLAGKGFVTADGKPALEFPPGFPLVLAGSFAAARAWGFSEELALRLQVVFCVGVSAILVYLIAARVFGLLTAVVAAVLWSTYPLQLWLTKQPDSGHIFNVFLLSAICILLHSDRGDFAFPLMFLAGLFIGIGSLVRPIGIALSAVFLCGLWSFRSETSQKRRAVLAGLIILGNLAAIAPWELWAHRVTGKWIPLSTSGLANILDGITLSAWRPSQGLTLTVPIGVRNLIGEYVANERNLTTTAEIGRFTFNEAVRHPFAMARLFAIKSARAWYATDSRRFEKISAIVQMPYILLFLCGVWYSRVQGGGVRVFTSFTLLFVMYFWAMTVLALSIVRYMLPAMALIVMFPAYLLTKIYLRRPHECSL